MSNSTKTIRRPFASLLLPRKVSDLVAYATRVVQAMTGNPAFPTPTPPLAVVSAAIGELQAAETAALARTKGAVTARNEKRVALLQQLKGYIQATADAAPENGGSIIESAGIALRKVPTHAARASAATPGAVSGSAVVTAAVAARRAAYDWEYSVDGGKTWVAAPGTLRARTTITGLPPATTVQFRHRAVTTDGQGDWSQPTSLLVP